MECKIMINWVISKRSQIVQWRLKHYAINVNRECTKLTVGRYQMKTHSWLGLRTAGGKGAVTVLDWALRLHMQGKYIGSVWDDSQRCISYFYCQNEWTWCGALSANTCFKARFENTAVVLHCYRRINFKKSPASGAGTISEPRLSNEGRVREFVCA